MDLGLKWTIHWHMDNMCPKKRNSKKERFFSGNMQAHTIAKNNNTVHVKPQGTRVWGRIDMAGFLD